MRQVEKKDIILRYLYERRDDGKQYNLHEVLAINDIMTNSLEVARLADDLSKDRFISLNDPV